MISPPRRSSRSSSCRYALDLLSPVSCNRTRPSYSNLTTINTIAVARRQVGIDHDRELRSLRAHDGEVRGHRARSRGSRSTRRCRRGRTDRCSVTARECASFRAAVAETPSAPSATPRTAARPRGGGTPSAGRRRCPARSPRTGQQHADRRERGMERGRHDRCRRGPADVRLGSDRQEEDGRTERAPDGEHHTGVDQHPEDADRQQRQVAEDAREVAPAPMRTISM